MGPVNVPNILGRPRRASAVILLSIPVMSYCAERTIDCKKEKRRYLMRALLFIIYEKCPSGALLEEVISKTKGFMLFGCRGVERQAKTLYTETTQLSDILNRQLTIEALNHITCVREAKATMY